MTELEVRKQEIAVVSERRENVVRTWSHIPSHSDVLNPSDVDSLGSDRDKSERYDQNSGDKLGYS